MITFEQKCILSVNFENLGHGSKNKGKQTISA